MYTSSHAITARIKVGSIIRADMASTFLEVTAQVPYIPHLFVVQSYCTRDNGIIRHVCYKRKPRLMRVYQENRDWCEVQSFAGQYSRTWGYCHCTLR